MRTVSVKTVFVALMVAAAVAVQVASAAGLQRSAYSANYVGSTFVAPQQISATNFYTDVALSAQSATAAVAGLS